MNTRENDDEAQESKKMEVKDGVRYAGKGGKKGHYTYTKDKKSKTMDSNSFTMDDIKKIVMQEHKELETAKNYAIDLLGGINQTFDSADAIYDAILTKHGHDVKDCSLNAKKQITKVIHDFNNKSTVPTMTMDSMFNQDSSVSKKVNDRISKMLEGA